MELKFDLKFHPIKFKLDLSLSNVVKSQCFPVEVVAIIGDNSTATAPQITFGRVIKVVDRDYAIISTFEEVSKNTFAFKIGAKERVRLKEIVTPIDMVYQPSKNTYSLRTPKTDIHLSRRPL